MSTSSSSSQTIAKQQEQKKQQKFVLQSASSAPAPAIKKKMTRQRRVFSWKGLEDERQKLLAAAQRILDADKKLSESHGDGAIITGTIVAYRNPDGAGSADFQEAGEATRCLQRQILRLVDDFNLNWEMVYQEWSSVLSAGNAEHAAMCQRNVDRAQGKQLRRDLSESVLH